MQDLLKRETVCKVKGDMCSFGMYQDVNGERKLVKKPTGFMTNASELAKELAQECDGSHEHVNLLNGRARRAEVFPKMLCYRILRGLINQMESDGRIQDGCLGAVMAEEEAGVWDDMSGERLDWQGVKRARGEEISEVHKHKVYVKVPITECWDRTGKAPIKVRWIDINEGDKVYPDYRSRIVAKDFKNDKRKDLFAATPPLRH